MARQGWRSDESGTYVYNENQTSGASAAAGVTRTGNVFSLTTLAAANATLNDAAQISVNPAVNGNITLTPKGTGTVSVSTTASFPATTDANNGVIRFAGERFIHRFNDPRNTFVGQNSGNFTLTGFSNSGLGRDVLISLTSGRQNTSIGTFNLDACTTGSNNTSVGVAGLSDLTTGSNNTTLGEFSGPFLNGSFNVLIGSRAGNQYTGTESNNIIVAGSNRGTVGESNTIRIGNNGLFGVPIQTACYIQGIYNQAPGPSELPVTVGTDGKLGTGGGTVATTFETDAGNATPAGNTLIVSGGTNINTAGAGNTLTINVDDSVTLAGTLDVNGGNVTVSAGDLLLTQGIGNGARIESAGSQVMLIRNTTNNTFLGTGAGGTTAASGNNTGIGAQSLDALTAGGSGNTAVGRLSLSTVSTGINNTGIGFRALESMTGSTSVAVGNSSLLVATGNNNVAIGSASGLNVTTGTNNFYAGASSGSAHTSTESDNIIIGSAGVIADSGVIRIGTNGTQTSNFQAGIYNVTPAGTQTLAIVDDNDQVGSGTTLSNDFTFTSSTAGATRTLSVENTATTGASQAAVDIEVDDTSTGDPYMRVSVNGGQDYSLGIDNSDSDSLKLTDDADPSTGNVFWKMTFAGESTMPAQPAFSAYLSATQNDVTGAGAVYPIICDTELYDQNNDYNAATGIFVAPVTGRYLFTGSAYLSQVTAAMDSGNLRFVTTHTADIYLGSFCNPGAIRDASNNMSFEMSHVITLTAGETCRMSVVIFNGAGNDADLTALGGNNITTWFSGTLLC